MSYSRKTIPRFEPEVIEATARKLYFGNTDKVATTSISVLVIDGVKITSRYNDADEFELMREMILSLPPMTRAQIKTIFCDSQATACFSVQLRCWINAKSATHIGQKLEAAVIARNGGHNGITVAAYNGTIFGDTDRNIEIGPEWQDC